MRRRYQLVTRFMIAALFVTPVLGACGRGSYYRIYDPYYRDFHQWNRTEDEYYRRWEAETRRPHVDFGRRPAEEQRTYLSWRHAR